MAGMLSISRMALALTTSGLRLDGAQLDPIKLVMDTGTTAERAMVIGTLTVIMEDIHSSSA